MSSIPKDGHWFTLLSEDELCAAVALDREPLYRFAAAGSPEMHILFVGTGKRMDSFLRLTLIVGQMLHRTLHIHVLAPDAEEYRQALLASATGLEQTTNIGGSMPASRPLAMFDFANQKALNSRGTGKLIRERYLDRCRYIVLDLPKKDVLLSSLAASCKEAGQAAIVLHTGDAQAVPDSPLRLYSLDTWNEAKRGACIRLSRQAFRLHYLYERKYGSIGPSREESLRAFTGEAARADTDPRYAQRANLTAVLHTKYKLASIGIDPDEGRQRTMEACGRLLYGSDRTLYDELTALEHRRWMMEKLLLGFRAPSLPEMILHCYNGARFSDKWWNGEHRFHNCLVESLPRSQSSLRGLTFSRWEALCGIGLSQEEALRRIQASGYDALDQVSLTVHHLAGQKMMDYIARVQALLRRLSGEIDLILDSGTAVPEHLTRPDTELAAWVNLLANSGDASRLPVLIRGLETYARALSLPEGLVTDITQSLHDLAKLAREYHGLKDYKAMDEDIIDLLAHVYMPDGAVILKIGAEASILDNITSPLLIEPARLVLTDVSQRDAGMIAEFFRRRGGFLETEYHPVSRTDPGIRMAQLKGLIARTRKQTDMLIVDLTGAPAGELLSLTDHIRTAHPDAAVIISDCRSQTVTGIHGFPEGACIRLTQKLCTDEIFRLIGAQRHHRLDEGDAVSLRSECGLLWDFYSRHADRIPEIASLVRAMVSCTRCHRQPPLLMRMPDAPEYTAFHCRAMPVGLFQALQLEPILGELQAHRFVTGLSITRHGNNTVSCSGSMLSGMLSHPLMQSLLSLSIRHPLQLSASPGMAALDYARAETRSLYVNVEFRSGSFQRLTLQRSRESSSFMAEALHRHLGRMVKEEHTLRHAYLTRKDAADKATSTVERVYSIVMPDPGMMVLQYHEKGREADRDQRIFAYPAARIDDLLREMEQAHLIEDLRIVGSAPGGEPRKAVSFLFASTAALNHLLTPGAFLESRIYCEACNLGIFDHVEANYKFAWDDGQAAAENEFDVLCVRGLHLLLISAKATDGTKEHLYEVSAMARRLSRTAQPVVIYSDRSRVRESHIARANDMGVLLAYAQGGNEDETISAVLRKGLGMQP